MNGTTTYYYAPPMDWWEPIKRFTGRWYIEEDTQKRQDLYVEIEQEGFFRTKKHFVDSNYIIWKTVYPIQNCSHDQPN